MTNRQRRVAAAVCCVAFSGILTIGCQTSKPGGARYEAAQPARRGTSSDGHVRRVVCLYQQSPWISVDLAGDRDPEGIQFRVFLDAGLACHDMECLLYLLGKGAKLTGLLPPPESSPTGGGDDVPKFPAGRLEMSH